MPDRAAPSTRTVRQGMGLDLRDARLLARLQRLGDNVPVAVPRMEPESVRDLVRVREYVAADLISVRHRLWETVVD